MKERLQKLLAQAGHGSRRSAEALITAGRVTVNGRTVTALGARADPTKDTIAVDMRSISLASDRAYLAMYKPAGTVTTSRDPRHRRTVMDLLPPELPPHVLPVGRLDRDTDGLLIFTNDGELAHRLTHPRYVIDKEYAAEVAGNVSTRALVALRTGVAIDGRQSSPATVDIVSSPRGYGTCPGHTWLRLIIHEGRKRQIRLMCAALGHPVRTLVRTRIDGVRLAPLAYGATRPLTAREVGRLYTLVGLAHPKRGPTGTTPDRARPASRATARASARQRARRSSVIAIDGPAASGKSAVGTRVAQRLRYRFVDTGAMYRAVTWLALQQAIGPHDEATLVRMCEGTRLDVRESPPGADESTAVFLDGVDATPHLREEDVEAQVSLVSRVPGVRGCLVRVQRDLANGGRLVMAGRDIGTVVLPDADLKVYLDAPRPIRAARRAAQLRASGGDPDVRAIVEDLARRDGLDSGRETSPLTAAADAMIIQTQHLDIAEVVERIVELVT